MSWLSLQARALKNQTNTLATQASDVKFKVQGAKQRASTLRGLVVEVSLGPPFAGWLWGAGGGGGGRGRPKATYSSLMQDIN